MATPTPPLTLRQRLNRFLRRGLLLIGGVLAFYACFLLLGFVPVNRDYVPPAEGDGVRIFVRSNEIHTDFVLPVVDEASGVDWRELFPPEHFLGDIQGYKYVAIGWGDRGFYIETPRWEDFQLANALRALFPNESVLRAEYLYDAASSESYREVQLSREQYRQLVEFIRGSVAGVDDQGHAIQATSKSYHACDRFYVAVDSYHAFNTCYGSR